MAKPPTVSRFDRALMKALSLHLLPKLQEDKAAFNDVLANDLLGLDGPRHVRSEYSQLEFDLWKIYRGHTEIAKSVDTLHDIAFYIRSFPYAEEAASPSRYLQFHAEAYVSEVYILRERMTALAKVVTRQSKRLRSPPGTVETFERAVAAVAETLEPVVRTRGAHTHEARLTDPAIDRLNTIALFVQFPDGGLRRVAQAQAKRAERDAFRKWRRITEGNNNAVRRLRRVYEKTLHAVVLFKGSPYLRAADA
jgi:hypothetical protein